MSSYLPQAEVAERVKAVLCGFDLVDDSKVTEVADFQNDLGLSSLDTYVCVCVCVRIHVCVCCMCVCAVPSVPCDVSLYFSATQC
jgi:hypothetical protein